MTETRWTRRRHEGTNKNGLSQASRVSCEPRLSFVTFAFLRDLRDVYRAARGFRVLVPPWGLAALALLDLDGVYGAPRFHKAARSAGIRPLIGAELTIEAADSADATDHQIDHQIDRQISRSRRSITRSPHHEITRFTLPVLVSSQQGWPNLCRLVSKMKLRAPKGEGALTIEDLDGQVGGLVALVGRASINAPRFGVGGLVDRLVGVFGRSHLYIELQRHLLR